MMSRKLVCKLACGSFAIALFGCSESDIALGSEGSYAIVEKIDDVKCDSDHEGGTVYEKATATMYSCSAGKWVSMNAVEALKQRCNMDPLKDGTGYTFVCDSDTIAVISNKSAESTTSTEEIYEAVYAKVEEKISGQACHVSSQDGEESQSTKNITISCGDVDYPIELPATTPNENLANVYKKTVFVRFPAIGVNCQESNRFFPELANNSTLNIREVDEKFNQTGKSFSSQMILKASDNGLVVYNRETNEEIEACDVMYRLEGEFSITNLMNSYAQLDVTLGKLPITLNRTTYYTDITFNAFVNMDSGDTIVLDYLTDFKAARVKTLLDGGSTFEVAYKQANAELASTLSLGSDFVNFENFMPAKYDQNELEVMTLLPGAVSSPYVSGNNKIPAVNLLYNGYRSIFGQNGNFSKPLDLTVSNGTAGYFIDYLYRTRYYNIKRKFIQKGFADLYGLPACNASQKQYYLSSVKDGAYAIFSCDFTQENWSPVNNYKMMSALDSIANYGDACTEGATKTLELKGVNYVYRCDYEEGWIRLSTVSASSMADYMNCEGKNDGDYLAFNVNDGVYGYCQTIGGELVMIPISFIEYENRVVCDEKNYGKILTSSDDDDYFICSETSKGPSLVRADVDDVVYYFNKLECDESNDQVTTAVYMTPGAKTRTNLKCSDGSWIEYSASSASEMLGVCDEKLAKSGELKKINVGELNISSETEMTYYKCELVNEDEYGWVYASETEVFVGSGCSSDRDGAVYGNYICKYEWYGYTWHENTLENYCEVFGEETDQDVYFCEYKNQYYNAGIEEPWMNVSDYCDEHGVREINEVNSAEDGVVDDVQPVAPTPVYCYFTTPDENGDLVKRTYVKIGEQEWKLQETVAEE